MSWSRRMSVTKNGTKKLFLKFCANKLKTKNQSANFHKYFKIFELLLENSFKQKYKNCQDRDRICLVLDYLLDTCEDLDLMLILGARLCQNSLLSDSLSTLISRLFEKYVENEKVEQFLKSVWFNSDLISQLPDIWPLYLQTYPKYLQITLLNILQGGQSNVWTVPDNHFLIQMCSSNQSIFISVSLILNEVFKQSHCSVVILRVIRQFRERVSEYCRQNNMSFVELYPAQVQTVVLCETLSVKPANLVKQYLEDVDADWKFILCTHFCKMSNFLLDST